MFKSFRKIALLSGVAIVGTSYFMDTASTEPKFVFRYTSGGVSTASNSGGNENPTSPEPETPQAGKIEYDASGTIRAIPNDDGSVVISTQNFRFKNTGDSNINGSIILNHGNGLTLPVCTNVPVFEAGQTYTCATASHTVSASNLEQFKVSENEARLGADFYNGSDLLLARARIYAPIQSPTTRLEIGHGSMSHFDANNDGAINAGDRISVSFPVTNIGEHTASNITAREVLFYIESEIYGFHNAFSANAQCTPTLISNASGECTGSLLVEEWMIPDNRSAYEFKSVLDGFNFSNNGGYVGPSGSDFLPLGTEMKIRFDGLQNWSFEPLPPTGNGYIEYFVYTNSGNGDPYSDYEIEVTIPELNAKSSCGETGIRHADARCVARIELTSEMQDKIYEGTPDTVTFKPYATLTKLGGRTTNQRLVDPDEEHRLNEFALQYDIPAYLNASNVTISNTGTNITNQRITVNGLSITNTSYNYVRNVDVGVYLGDGYDVFIKNVCPAAQTMKPRQTVNCDAFSYTLTPAQQKILRDGFGSGRTVNANNQIYISGIGREEFDRNTYPMPNYDLVIN